MHHPEAPPYGAVDVVACSWPPVPSNVAAARRFVAAALTTWRQPEALVDAVVLVTSEMATNAVLHAGSDFEVSVQRLPDGLLLRVNDHSPRPPVQRSCSATSTTGRGTYLLDALCRGWGAVDDGLGGKAVWALLDPESADCPPADVRVLASA